MFPSSDLNKTLSQNIPVGNLVPSSNPRHSNPSNPLLNTRVSKVPWNKAVAVITIFLGVIGPLIWLLILSHIWSPARGALIPAVTAIAFLYVRLSGKWLYGTFRRTLFPKLNRQNTESGHSGTSIRDISRLPGDPFVQCNTHGALTLFVLWIWRRITVLISIQPHGLLLFVIISHKSSL